MSQTVLKVEGLRKVYPRRGNTPVVAVDDVTFSVRRGEVVGLLGANGAGKTTSIKCVCTLIRPTAGAIEVAGVDAIARPRKALTRLAAVLEGNRNIYWTLSPRQNMEFFAGLQGIPRRAATPYIDAILASFDLTAKADTQARMLSRGMQQKLALGCALVKQTDVMLLDEPTLGLDVKTSYELRRVLRDAAAAHGRTVLLSSHDMQVVEELCDRVIVINKGRVVADERVSTLLSLFQASALRVTLEQPLGAAQRDGIGRWIEGVRYDEGGAALELEMGSTRSLYDVIDVFRDNGAAIRTVERRAPRLEEVFLALTTES